MTSEYLNRRSFIVGSAGVTASLLLAGCTTTAKAPGGQNAATKSLNVLWPSGNASAALEAILPAFKKHFGFALNVDFIPYDAQKQKAFAEFATNSSHYDIVMVDAPWGPALCQKLEPLGGYLSKPKVSSSVALDDFVAAVFYDTCVYKASDTHLNFDSNDAPNLSAIQSKGFDIYGLPMHANALTMFYRADLFENPAEKAAYKQSTGKELIVPKTWDEFASVAKFFTRPDKKLWGTTLMAGVGDWATDDFKTILGSMGGNGRMIGEDFGLDFAGPKGVQALSFYQDLIRKHKVVPAGTTSASWDTTSTTFSTGLTAMTMNYFPQTLNANVTGSIGYATVPAGQASAPHMGTSMLSVNKFSKNKAKAVEAVVWLTSQQSQETMVKDGAHPTRVSAFKAAGSDPFYRVLGEALATGVGRPRLTNYEAVSAAIAAAVNRAANGGDPAQELSAVATEVKALLKSAGYKS
jgi:multiple sugar transport system substrate-binding protein